MELLKRLTCGQDQDGARVRTSRGAPLGCGRRAWRWKPVWKGTWPGPEIVFVCPACEAAFVAASEEEREARRQAELERWRSRRSQLIESFPATLGGFFADGRRTSVSGAQIANILADLAGYRVLESVNSADRSRLISILVDRYEDCLHYLGESRWRTDGYKTLAGAIENFLADASAAPGVADEMLDVARRIFWEHARTADMWAEDLASRRAASVRREAVTFLCDVHSGNKSAPRSSSDSFHRHVDAVLRDYVEGVLQEPVKVQ